MESYLTKEEWSEVFQRHWEHRVSQGRGDEASLNDLKRIYKTTRQYQTLRKK
jgi:hypothetical protein